MRTVINSGTEISKREGQKASENKDTVKGRQPWWLVLCFAISGLGCAWYSTFKWFSGRFSLCSGPVLHAMGLTVVLSASIAFLTVRVLGMRLRDIAAVFFLVSIAVLGHILLWIRHT